VRGINPDCYIFERSCKKCGEEVFHNKKHKSDWVPEKTMEQFDMYDRFSL
jgi:hypothetical protein